jgi:hypothetical protein
MNFEWKQYRVTCFYPDGEVARVLRIASYGRDGVDYIMTDQTDNRCWPWGWHTEEV